MKKSIYPSEPHGTVSAPASKSEMQRAVAAAALAHGRSTILNPSFCDDSVAAISMARALGSRVEHTPEKVIIDGGLNPVTDELHCGESGLGIRMFTPIAALTGRFITLSGKGSLMKRPVSAIEHALMELGTTVRSDNGFPPIVVSSRLKGGSTTIDGSLSSQFLTGLLMALPAAEKDSVITVVNLKSRQYIDITLKILKLFSVSVENPDYSRFSITGRQKFIPATVKIEGDWSGAAFLFCAGAISGSVTVTGLEKSSLQPDRAVMDALNAAGATVTEGEGCVTVESNRLKGFNFDASECPDLFPPLAALAMYCEGRSVITGALRLKHKESDRAEVIHSELGKLGGKISVHGDVMTIDGSSVNGGTVDSHGDHRIAMACAIAALRADGPVMIEHAESVDKSYNEFYRDISALGVDVR